MENQVDIKPEDTSIKYTIDNILQEYTDVKRLFFMNSHKTNNPDAPEIAAETYTALINMVYSLLDLSKADNTDKLNTIMEIQSRLEELDNIDGEVTDDIINELKTIVFWVDTVPLRPFLSTQPNIAPCIYHNVYSEQTHTRI